MSVSHGVGTIGYTSICHLLLLSAFEYSWMSTGGWNYSNHLKYKRIVEKLTQIPDIANPLIKPETSFQSSYYGI